MSAQLKRILVDGFISQFSLGGRPMRAKDVMTSEVITVEPGTSVQALASLLAERGISGVPVVEGGRVIGIVSEGDLLHRTETGTERRTQPRRSRWFDAHVEDAARDYVKSHSRTVRDLMTREVIAVADTADLAEVAAVMETNRIKRVPVMRDGKLVGIISRANLVRALVAAKSEPTPAAEADDRTIRQKLLAELNRRDWVTLWAEDVIVKDGTVHFWLFDQPEVARQALRVAAENIPGVRGVEEHIAPVPRMPAF
jgi:CBS domain-containing protein